MKLQKIISNLILEFKMEDYFQVLKKYNKDYILDTNPTAFAMGQKVENNLKKIYSSLTDEAKFQCAIAFKDFYTKKYDNQLKNWNPTDQYQLKKFDGYNVIGITDKK